MKRAKILFIVGLILISAGAGLFYLESRKTAKAAPRDYDIDYNITQCRAIGLQSTGGGSWSPGHGIAQYVFVGAAQWEVDITGDISAHETWTASDWVQGTTAGTIFYPVAAVFKEPYPDINSAEC